VEQDSEEGEESRRHSFLQEEARMLSPIYRAAEQSGHQWRKRALCSETSPEVADYWFAKDGTFASAVASDTCFVLCPVRKECLKWASGAKQRFGIWGGLPSSIRLQKVSMTGEKGRPHDYDSLVELEPPYSTTDPRSRFHHNNLTEWQGEEEDE
jgi:hypothetical protein